ncbi:hypothetical protein [Rhodococcus kronopolitis]|uniref:Uncharacterized protein n=1 Tax=Rhodococcus kronopolitis TaxID=1460226 RepID=A0ABV9FUH4_9NOCA
MVNSGVQDAIVAFVDSLRPNAQMYHDMYMNGLYSFVDMQSHLLTLLGYPPVD